MKRGCRLHPLEPGAHCDGQLVAGLVRDMQVAVERDVRHRVFRADDEVASRQVLVEQQQELLARRASDARVPIARSEPPGQEPEAKATDGRDHVGLLEDEPAVRPALAAHGSAGKQRPCRRRGAARIACRLGQRLGAVADEHRRGARGVESPVLLGQRVAGEDVDRDALVLAARAARAASRTL